MSLLTTAQASGTAVPTRDALSIAADVSLIAMALAAVVLAVFIVLQLHRLGTLLQEIRRQVSNRAEPMLDRGRAIAANVEYISATVRTDVEKVNGSVRALSDRLQQASDRMEERIEEFNALMEVVQGEAESAFIGTASTVRGLKAGAEHLRDGAPEHGPSEGEPAAREVRIPDELGATEADPSSERSA